MAESETEISNEELKKEITVILTNASLDKTSTKKVIQKLEKKLGVDLSGKRKIIDEMVMEYVNSMDSEEDSEEEAPVKVVPKKKSKKANDDEDDEDDLDNSDDSDWGHHHHHHHQREHHEGRLLAESADDSCCSLRRQPTTTTSGIRPLPNFNQPRKLILKRVADTTHAEDEADVFGKLTAKKLRKLPEEERDAMMIQINQLFYTAKYRRSNSPQRQPAGKTAAIIAPIQEALETVFDMFTPTDCPTDIFGNKPPRIVVTINGLKPIEPESNSPNPVEKPSNEPNPMDPKSNGVNLVVQPSKTLPDITPEPFVAPATEEASGNNKNAGSNCNIM